jgi:hypothetical protein
MNCFDECEELQQYLLMVHGYDGDPINTKKKKNYVEVEK